MSGGTGSIATHLVRSGAAVGFFREEFFRALKSRQAALIIAAVIYSMIAMPFLLAKPHEEVLTGLRSWFGESQLDLRFFLFVWFDLVMNKITVLCGAVLALLALLNLVFLFARETYYAVLLAFAVFALVVLPIGLFMYRPDVFQDQPVLRNLVVFPVNLLWINEWLPNIAPVIAFVAATLSLLLLACGGWRLKRMDIQ